uniref:(northern house mosquito) hypothetical protein n=1 Tax=Culex pipiens TaxID=7175 RepID=A0A8D8AS51_CULPI
MVRACVPMTGRDPDGCFTGGSNSTELRRVVLTAVAAFATAIERRLEGAGVLGASGRGGVLARFGGLSGRVRVSGWEGESVLSEGWALKSLRLRGAVEVTSESVEERSSVEDLNLMDFSVDFEAFR